jgi:CSLREA domain-containing protein
MKNLYLALFLAILAVPRPGAGSILVTDAGDEKKANGACTLREAVQTALDYSFGGSLFYPECATSTGKDLIEFQPGLGTIELPELGWINLSSNLTIQGPAEDDLQEISGIDKTRIFAISNGSKVTLRNLSLTKGNASGDEGTAGSGGALLVDGGSADVTIESCWFHDNEAARGGAISFHAWKLKIIDSAFDANRSHTFGGAIDGGATGGWTMEDTIFDSNRAEFGGGAVYCDGGGLLSADRMTFVANTAAGKRPKGLAVSGGGGLMSGCETYLTHNLFLVNMVYGEIPDPADPADDAIDGGGGGLYLAKNGSAKISRSVFRGNNAGVGPKTVGSGGAIFAQGTLDLERCAIEDNTASGGHGGGGIVFDSSYGEIENTMLRANRSVTDDWVFPQPPKDPASGGAIAVIGNATIDLLSSSLVNNFGAGEIFVSGQGTVGFRNTLIGPWMAKESCELSASSLIFDKGYNVEAAVNATCGFKQDLAGAVKQPHAFPVQIPGGYTLDFTYTLPIFTSAAAGQGDCSNPVVPLDLLDTLRQIPCTIGAIEIKSSE